ncbi:ABC transporter permease [Nocardiopsis chromatogenes]|uniref:ABC transporter permease n=1 Tax=Nocardiopsis chromatogenes TaxID=280239 RepID=UPI000346C231|nr:ABC transporter permease [Nocardiopsis chromatogenes]
MTVLRLGASRAVLELREYFREGLQVVFTFALPFLLLLLFTTVFGQGFEGGTAGAAAYYVPTLTAMGLMAVSFQNLGTAIAAERGDGTLRRLRGLPLPAASYFAGKAGMVLVLAVLQTALLVGTGAVAMGMDLPTDPRRWLDLAWILLLGTAACTLLGIAVSSAARTARAAQAVVALPFLLLQFASGVFVPVQVLPPWLVNMGAAFPLRWMAQGLRSVFLPESAAAAEAGGSWELGTVALVLAAWCAGGSVLCLLTFRWKSTAQG